MTPTTVSALAEAVERMIAGLTPSAEMHRDTLWAVVDDPEKVPGAELRRFFLDFQGAHPAVSGIFTPSELEYEVSLMVWTSYARLRGRGVDGLAEADGRDIWLGLETRRDQGLAANITGLVSATYDGWDAEDDEQGRHWGAHQLTLRYLAPGIPTT